MENEKYHQIDGLIMRGMYVNCRTYKSTDFSVSVSLIGAMVLSMGFALLSIMSKYSMNIYLS